MITVALKGDKLKLNLLFSLLVLNLSPVGQEHESLPPEKQVLSIESTCSDTKNDVLANPLPSTVQHVEMSVAVYNPHI